jgi:RecA-family ATPase
MNIPKYGEIISHKSIVERIAYDFVVYGLQRGEIGVLFGQGAVGKGYFLKHFFTNENNLLFEKPIKILYLSLEDDFISITNKYDNMKIVHKCIDFGFDLGTEKSWKDYDLVIIDTWSRYLAGEFDENSNKEMGKAYEKIIKQAKEYNCAMLVVAHTNKAALGEEELDIGALRGASVLSDNSRLAISLEKISSKKNSSIKVKTQKINRKAVVEQVFTRSSLNGELQLQSNGGF